MPFNEANKGSFSLEEWPEEAVKSERAQIIDKLEALKKPSSFDAGGGPGSGEFDEKAHGEAVDLDSSHERDKEALLTELKLYNERLGLDGDNMDQEI